MSENIYGKDLYLSHRSVDIQVSDRDTVDLQESASGDLKTVSGKKNLIQAILNRLFTRKSELARLGHPHYGSRLYTLIGELNNKRTKALAQLYIRECLMQEKRIKNITQISFPPAANSSDCNTLVISIALEPKGGEEELAFTFSLNLEG